MKTSPHSPGAGPIRLNGALDIYRADELRTTLANCLADAPSLSLDLSAVDECDTAGLQLLLSASTTARTQGKAVAFHNSSAPVADCCRRLGLPALDAAPAPRIP